MFLEPVQNTGGCFVPSPGYFARVREICDKHDVLLVSDEVICAFGRVGYDFAAKRYGYQPDIVTTAKGLTSGCAPLGAVLASERLMEPFTRGETTFMHGSTYGGHPVWCAVALANLDLIAREGLYDHVFAHRGRRPVHFGQADRSADRRGRPGAGFFYGIELVKDKATRETFSAAESERVLRGVPFGRLVRGRVVLPGRRPGRARGAAFAAADLRPAGVRRDGADSAGHADPAWKML